MRLIRHLILKLRIRSLRFDIVTTFLGMLFLTLGLIITHTYHRNSQVIVEFSHNLMSEVAEVARVNVMDLLEDAADATELGSSFIQAPQDVTIENKGLIASLLSALHFNPSLQFYGLATVDGRFIAAARLLPGLTYEGTDEQLPKEYTQAIRIIADGVETWIYYDAHGTERERREVTSGYAPLERPWYVQTKEEKKLVWSPIYYFDTTDTYGLTISFPIYDADNTFIGVFATDLSIVTLSDFTARQKVAKSGVEIVFDSEKDIIAAPPKIANMNLLKDQEHPTLDTIDDKRFSKAYDVYLKTNDEDFIFEYDDDKYLATIIPFAKQIGKDWYILIIAPLDEFLGKILTIFKHNIYISIGIFIVTAICIMLISMRISRPIVKLADEIDQIKQFHLERKISLRSYIKEIRQITFAVVSMKNAIRSFGHFVPKQIVEKLVVKGRSLRLGGETKRLTIFFSDITNFTQLSEGMDSEALMLHISDYLDELSKIIMQNHGTIDKYIGDSIMAFWGAPDDDPHDAEHAAQTALMCQQKLSQLNEKWAQENKPVLHTRIGLHKGDVIVGNIGTSERMNYTVIGDTVNLASRLEGINKYYGTMLIISEDVACELPDSIITRPLDIVAVKGKEHKTKIYELLTDTSLAERFTKAFEAFTENNFDKACALFQEIARDYPDDRPTQIYIDRCQKPDEWSGVFRLESK